LAEQIQDCVVVGAGPAGSAAALQMARDGLDVVLLERGTRPGDKNVMSGVMHRIDEKGGWNDLFHRENQCVL
jgi:flavin-dependent dehydrogenase